MCFKVLKKLQKITENISKCLNGKINSYKGVRWLYTTSQVLPGEIWASIHPKLIEGYKNYEISTKGRIKRHDGKITYGYKNDIGYMVIRINNKNFLIHRLVALVFISNIDKQK